VPKDEFPAGSLPSRAENFDIFPSLRACMTTRNIALLPATHTTRRVEREAIRVARTETWRVTSLKHRARGSIRPPREPTNGRQYLPQPTARFVVASLLAGLFCDSDVSSSPCSSSFHPFILSFIKNSYVHYRSCKPSRIL